MKEQIEKLARDICHLNVSCDECTMLAKQMGQSKERYCKAMQYAKRAYEKGWTKQSVGEWVVTYNNGVWHYGCPFCDGGYAQEAKLPVSNYCENCGAKLHEPKAKGGE